MVYTDLPIWATLEVPTSVEPATEWAPVAQLASSPSSTRPTKPSTTRTAASTRWPRSGSAAMFSSRSTPRNMITNRKSTTMAPA